MSSLSVPFRFMASIIELELLMQLKPKTLPSPGITLAEGHLQFQE
jgi:hypothetical protein